MATNSFFINSQTYKYTPIQLIVNNRKKENIYTFGYYMNINSANKLEF